jgi:hypothetical protein
MSAINSYIDEISDGEEVEDIEDSELLDEPEIADPKPQSIKAASNVGETSVEIDVEELIAELEADSGIKCQSSEQLARKRLEAVLEQRRAARELEDIDEFDLAN